MKAHRAKPIFHILTLLAVLASLLGSAMMVTPAYAATLTVTNTNDSGAGSLRDTIAAAGVGDTITFDPVLAGGTIYLASTLNLSKNVTIDGSALISEITISGDSDNNGTGDVEVFAIGATITLNSLIITKGYNPGNNYTGGGISSNGTLTILNSTISNNYSGNEGGGIYNSGTLTITDSTLAGNYATQEGGGIYNGGALTVINSTLSGNSSYEGGGITSWGTLTVTNSTLYNNFASWSGGGIENGTTGTVTNSTLYNNSEGNLGNVGDGGGGIYNNENATLIVTNSTFYGNSALGGGGIFTDINSTLTITNSTFSRNSALFAYNAAGIVNIEGTLNYANTIIANSSLGGDCDTEIGTMGTNTNNLVGDGSCSAALSGNPNLAPLANYGGPTQTLALVAGSPAIDAGNDAICAAAPVSGLDQRGITRQQGAHCDIGAFEGQVADTFAPTVISINRASASPTASAHVNFTVAFSEPVTGVSVSDFSVTSTGISGAGVSGVSGSGSSYTVTVSTGSGNGTIRLDVPASATITDLAANPLAGLPFTTGQTYTINKTMTINSSAAQDGWILESSETSNVGGILNATATTFNLGDDKTKKQYRGILSFSTGALPDNATITGVMLKVMKSAIVGGGNPVSIFKGFMVDIKKGFFGATALQATDFQTLASKTYGPFLAAPVGNWYSINLTAGKAYVNKLSTNGGLTQIRLRFNLDDNNNAIANYLSLYSGNAPAASRPQLVITYYVP